MRTEEPEKTVPIINGDATEIMYIRVVLSLEGRA